MPSGWVNTGENIGAGAGNDGIPANGIISVPVAKSDVTNVNFGVDHEPESYDKSGTLPSQPSTDQFVTLDGSIANVPFLTGSDPEDQPVNGTLSGKDVAITSLPTNGELWYNGSKIEFGADGVNPPSNTNPFIINGFAASDLQVKLTGSGYTSTAFNYAYIDRAGVIDPTPATYTLSWIEVKISGTVFNDANGLNPTPFNTVDGTPIQSLPGAIPTPLYANLFDNAGVFIATVPVDASGNYSFFVSTDQTYSVTITTTPATTGSTPASSNGLPSGWVNTGENIGAGAGNDGIPANGIISVPVAKSDVTNVNFGVDHEPESYDKSGTLPSQPSTDQFVTLDGSIANVPFLTGSDPEDQPVNGTLSGKDVAITSLPTNGELWYNGSKIEFGADGVNPPSNTNPFIINGFAASDLQVKLTGSGYTSTAFDYAYIDRVQALLIQHRLHIHYLGQIHFRVLLNWDICLIVELPHE